MGKSVAEMNLFWLVAAGVFRCALAWTTWWTCASTTRAAGPYNRRCARRATAAAPTCASWRRCPMATRVPAPLASDSTRTAAPAGPRRPRPSSSRRCLNVAVDVLFFHPSKSPKTSKSRISRKFVCLFLSWCVCATHFACKKLREDKIGWEKCTDHPFLTWPT